MRVTKEHHQANVIFNAYLELSRSGSISLVGFKRKCFREFGKWESKI